MHPLPLKTILTGYFLKQINMRNLLIPLIAATVLFSACSGPEKKYAEYEAGPSTTPATTAAPDSSIAPAAVPRTAAEMYAEGILSGKIKLTGNNETYAWLDSLQSANAPSRQLAYRVTEFIINYGHGSLAESAGAHLSSYVQVYPKDFVNNYRAAKAVTQKNLDDNLAYEFYASGSDYGEDIGSYFNNLSKACTDCTAAEEQVLAALKKRIWNLVKIKNG